MGVPEEDGHGERGDTGRGGESDNLRTGLGEGSVGGAPEERSSSGWMMGFSVAVEELEDSFGEASLDWEDIFSGGSVDFSWSRDEETRLRRAFSFARL